jgi:predicted transcriptional regulator
MLFFQHFNLVFPARDGRLAGEMSDVDPALARREREVMAILFRRGEATAKEIQDELVDPPTYSAVRALLATMTQKTLVTARKDSRRYVYRAAMPEKKAKRSALRQLLATFFDGRPEKLVAALLDPKDQSLSETEIQRIRELIGKEDGK